MNSDNNFCWLFTSKYVIKLWYHIIFLMVILLHTSYKFSFHSSFIPCFCHTNNNIHEMGLKVFIAHPKCSIIRIKYWLNFFNQFWSPLLREITPVAIPFKSSPWVSNLKQAIFCGSCDTFKYRICMTWNYS